MIAHLWQSTLFAAIVWLAALALRANGARVRYWLWTAASVKFLVPFSWLVGLGAEFQWRTAPAVVQPAASFVIEEVLTPPVLSVAPATSAVAASASPMLPWVLASLWLVGTIAVLAWWWRQWRPVGAALRRAAPVDLGPSFDTFDLVVMSSPSALEPGVVGFWRPVLLLPDGLAERLTHAQLAALIAHERCHIRCHDNLAAAVHMLVEAVFWFHPLVWWIERRMIDERERACDEAVLRAGNEPQDYAEGILEVCRSSLESPLACVAGVSGANLRRRIESIMGDQKGRPMTIARRLALALAGAALVGIPVLAGLVSTAIPLIAVGQEPSVPVVFEVAAVRVNISGDVGTWFRDPPGGGFTATNATLEQLIRWAYQIAQNQIVNLPGWAQSTRYDITARLEREPAAVARTGADDRRLAVRSLLADRFKLVVHREPREFPMYALVLARSDRRPGPRLTPSSADCSPEIMQARRAAAQAGKPMSGMCGTLFTPGSIRFGGFPMSEFAKALSPYEDRTVVDRTGLSGNWEFDLMFTPDRLPAPPPGQDTPAIDPNGPPFVTALRDQLGLRLEPTKGLVEVLVVDRVEQLSEDQAGGQAPPAADRAVFDAVSIRENQSGSAGGGGRPRPGGGYTATNLSTRALISIAYEIPTSRVLGASSWLDAVRYDIVAVGAEDVSQQDRMAALQAMLRDRFQLRAHVERRELPVYFLVVAHSDGRLGPNVRPAAVNCRDVEAAKKAFAAAKAAGSRAPCGITFAQTGYVIGGERLSVLEGMLTSASGRPVLDRTGLTGPYDIDLVWNRTDAERPDAVSIFTAVQEQLGLRLESGIAPLDVVVIDGIERPSEN